MIAYLTPRLTIVFLLFLLVSDSSRAQHTSPSWGDQGNGTYINPVLYADYSDPDVIRVAEKYYMVCSEFHYMGMPVLESSDLVNWKIIGQIYNHLDFPQYDSNLRYAGGSWAPTIRYHNNKFWVYFCTPDEGLFMSSADSAAGPWSPLVLVKKIPKWEDPCPFWDEDGKAYLGHSVHGAGPIIMHRLNADGTQLLDEGVTVYTGPVAEGTKIHKINGYYYISIPEGGVGEGWQTVLRSKNIYGPYEKKVVLEKGSTAINGPHQGALVETPKGEWWFYHFQSDGAMGRVLHLQPVQWQEGWPLIGVDIDRNGIGEPVYVWKKPDIAGSFPIRAPQADDEFNTATLGLQWQWNHNPVNEAWSLTQQPGWLTLKALQAGNFAKARNTCTQKVMGTTGEVITELDISNMADGQKAGLCSMSKIYNLLGVYKKAGKLYLFTDRNGQVQEEKQLTVKKIFLKLALDIKTGNNRFYYSVDNKTYTALNGFFETKWGYWKGTRIGLFSFNEVNEAGAASFNRFIYQYDGPKGSQ
jgi:beta-xylosidase